MTFAILLTYPAAWRIDAVVNSGSACAALSLLQSDCHRNRHAGARGYHEHAWLRCEITGESREVRYPVPGLYTDEIGPRLRPDAKIGRVGITDPQPRSAVGAVGYGTAVDCIEDDDVVPKKGIRERQAPIRDGRWMALHRQQSVGVEAPDRIRLIAGELDEMR